MSKRLLPIITGAVIAMLTATSFGPPSGVQAQSDCQTFKETGKSVCGKFLAYWKANGGLTQQGFPISTEFQEIADTDGKQYTVQYFERAVFEAHPENKAPYDVLLSLLGTAAYKQKYPQGAQELPPDMRAEAGMTFPETGKEIRGVFLAYWKAHGGLAQQGFPITNLISEKSPLDGKVYTMQYFERAVFELHPENKPPYNVLLTQLGAFKYRQKYPNAPSATNPSVLAAGQWGGKGISLMLDGKNIHLEYDCANGTIPGTAIFLDASGGFEVQGTHTFESGGPVNSQSGTTLSEVTYPARYKGTVKGNVLTLTVTVTNDPLRDIPPIGTKVLGPFTLALNAQPDIHKCM